MTATKRTHVAWPRLPSAFKVNAKNAELVISKADSRQKEDLHKAPWTWWRDTEDIYFILTGGTYVKPDLNKIEKKLKEKINGG